MLVDIKNTFRFWHLILISKETRNYRIVLNPKARLETRDIQQPSQPSRGADTSKGETKKEIEGEAKKETAAGVESGELAQESWQTVARVINRFAGLVYYIVAFANFFLFLFPFFLFLVRENVGHTSFITLIILENELFLQR